jgi:NADH:ubiquinone oxidoreductase subunit K
MMMAQNIPMKQYLASKVGLMTFSIIVLGILTTPYAYFGWNIFWLNLACAFYNVGVNIPVLLFATSFNKKRIDLDKSPFMNYQGTSAAQWLVALPLMILPLGIWYIAYEISNETIATATLAVLGIIGLLLRKVLLNKIVSLYKKQKYAMINGFRQQEN